MRLCWKMQTIHGAQLTLMSIKRHLGFQAVVFSRLSALMDAFSTLNHSQDCLRLLPSKIRISIVNC